MSESLSPYKAQIDVEQHMQHPWKAHALLHDFEIEDVWRLPVVLTAEQSAAMVRSKLLDGLNGIQQNGAAGFLFKLRLFIGRIFGWDGESEMSVTLRSGSLRERYAKGEGLTAEQLPKPTGAEFVPVYVLAEEFLDEIENATVHAGLHLGRVPLDETRFTMQMAIYVKPKGLFGRAYMAAIRPFRHWIVYPAIMRMIEKQWAEENG